MDSITQAALGSVVGTLVLGRKLGRRAIGWGALFGTIPDLDAVILPFLDTIWDLRLHRGVSHSILIMLVASFGLAKPLARRWKKSKVTPKEAGAFVFLCWSTHVLIDVFTVYGTQLFSPFSGYPVSLDNLFIIDPLFTLPLLVAVVWGLFLDPKQWKKGKGLKMTAVCLTVSCGYVGLSFWAKSAASNAFEQDLVRRGISWDRKMEAPVPFGIVLWRGLIEKDDEIWLAYHSLLDGDEPIVWTVFPKGGATLDEWKGTREVDGIRRFSKDWCIARPTAKGVWMVDMRFGESREEDKRGTALRPRAMFAWEYKPDGRGDPLKQGDRRKVNFGQALGRLYRRSLGDREGWEEPPRLIGNPAVVQEFLGTVR